MVRVWFGCGWFGCGSGGSPLALCQGHLDYFSPATTRGDCGPRSLAGGHRLCINSNTCSSAKFMSHSPGPAFCASVLAVVAYWGEFGGNMAITAIHAARRGRRGGVFGQVGLVQYPAPVFLLFLPIGASSVGIRPLLRSMQLVAEDAGEFSNSPCAPAASEPEADVVDRRAKSG